MLEVLITSGGTKAKIDDVRNLGNASTGTTGSLIAEEFLKRGARVKYVYCDNATRPFRKQLEMDPTKQKQSELERISAAYDTFNQYASNLEEHHVTFFEEYYAQVEKLLTTTKVDVIVLASAVGDYGYDAKGGKLSSDEEKLTLEFRKNPKVISLVKQWNPNVYLVGFKLLSGVTDDVLINTAYKHADKNHSDLTVANVVLEGEFAKRKTFLVTPEKEVTPTSEEELAKKLVDAVFRDTR